MMKESVIPIMHRTMLAMYADAMNIRFMGPDGGAIRSYTAIRIIEPDIISKINRISKHVSFRKVGTESLFAFLVTIEALSLSLYERTGHSLSQMEDMMMLQTGLDKNVILSPGDGAVKNLLMTIKTPISEAVPFPVFPTELLPQTSFYMDYTSPIPRQGLSVPASVASPNAMPVPERK